MSEPVEVNLRPFTWDDLLLGVDTENPTGALGLYESAGFRAWKKAVTYRKTLQE